MPEPTQPQGMGDGPRTSPRNVDKVPQYDPKDWRTWPATPTGDEEAELLMFIQRGVRPLNYRLRCFYDQVVNAGLGAAIEDYEPKLWSNPAVPREVLRGQK